MTSGGLGSRDEGFHLPVESWGAVKLSLGHWRTDLRTLVIYSGSLERIMRKDYTRKLLSKFFGFLQVSRCAAPSVVYSDTERHALYVDSSKVSLQQSQNLGDSVRMPSMYHKEHEKGNRVWSNESASQPLDLKCSVLLTSSAVRGLLGHLHRVHDIPHAPCDKYSIPNTMKSYLDTLAPNPWRMTELDSHTIKATKQSLHTHS